MSRPDFVSRNGVLIPSREACISVFNPAIQGAYGVYESMQVVAGGVFAQAAHLRRLARSAAILDLPLPAPLSRFERWIADLLAASQTTEATVRLFVVSAEDGGEVTAYIWLQPPTVYPRSYYVDGAPAVTFEGQRFLPQAKSLNTLASFLARRQAQAAGAHEGLLCHAGYLTEGSNSNLFAVMDGVMLTPPADQVLSGVTRDIVIELARQNGIPLHEAPLRMADLPRWSECFITSTSRHIMPVAVIDGRPVGDGRVGSLTRRLSALFESCFAKATAPCLEPV